MLKYLLVLLLGLNAMAENLPDGGVFEVKFSSQLPSNFTCRNSVIVPGIELNGYAIKFNGFRSSIYQTQPGHVLFFSGTPSINNFSISMWVKTNSDIPTTNQSLLSLIDTSYMNKGYTLGYRLFINMNGNVDFVWNADCNFNCSNQLIDMRSDKSKPNSNRINVCDMKWHNIIIVMDRDGMMDCYIDSVLDLSTTGMWETMTATGGYTLYNLCIGSTFYNDNYTLEGSVDNIRIYKKTLSESDVGVLYREKTITSNKLEVNVPKLNIRSEHERIALYDINGRMIQSNRIDYYTLKNGIYFVRNGKDIKKISVVK
jgi:hypothetical protein